MKFSAMNAKNGANQPLEPTAGLDDEIIMFS
jgi:hypothetical protein